MILQDFYRIDSDLSKRQLSLQLCKTGSPADHIPVDLSNCSVSCPFTVLYCGLTTVCLVFLMVSFISCMLLFSVLETGLQSRLRLGLELLGYC